MSWCNFYAVLFHGFSFSALGSHLLHAFGILWLWVEIFPYFFPELDPLWAQEYWWIFLLAGGAFGLWRAWPRLTVRSDIAGTDASIEIRVGDVFKQEGAVVVAAPTSFDTAIDDGTIHKMSAQGQYIRRFCDSLDNLDRQIGASLKGLPYEERDLADKPYGSRRLYPVGTVASVKFKEKRAYLVAIATLNSHRTASATRNELLDALPALWENVRTRGGMEPISVPVLGSGFSRLNSTREELVREIIKSFVAATHAGRFCERLAIMISLKDFREKRIDLESLGRFLEHECRYGNAPPPTDSESLGTAV